MIPRLSMALAALSLVALLAACTGTAASNDGVATIGDTAAADPDASPSPAASVDPQEAFLEFARCMREHGVDMPDPQVDGEGRFSVGFRSDAAGKIDDEGFEEANEACQPLLEKAIGDGPRGAGISPEEQDRLIEHARCMREHGVDMPDPQFDSGRGVVRMAPGTKPIDDEEFQAALEACGSLLPGGRGGPSVQIGPGGGADGGAGVQDQTETDQ